MNRRTMLKVMGTGIALVALPSYFWLKKMAHKALDLVGLSPIDRTKPSPAPLEYSGDNPTKAHAALWDKAGYLQRKGVKELIPQEKTKLVVIGGGVSGLSSAYLLKELKPIILEQAPRFGGNSKGESWNGIDYSIGAAYFTRSDEGTDLEKFLKEIGADKFWVEKTEEDPVIINNKVYKNFWSGESSLDKTQFDILRKHFLSVYNEENSPYPTIPIEDPSQRKSIEELDTLSFIQYCEKLVGGKLHDHIRTAVEHYCWSSFGASAKEISAAQGLNFYAGEFGPLLVLPGGNSKVAELLLEKLSQAVPSENLRNESLVFEVKVTPEGVLVSYENGLGEIKTILAEQVVLSCPKFVVKKILVDIEDDRKKAIESMSYNSYLVANVCINKHIPKDFYDLYLAGAGKKLDYDKVQENSLNQKITDVVYGNFARPHESKTVITLYRALPFPGSRGMIFDPKSFNQIKDEFLKQVESEILPLLKVAPSDVAEIRIARWGHPLPVARVGAIKDKTVDILRSPFKDKVFFIEQDNWLLPALETCITEALLLTPLVKKDVK